MKKLLLASFIMLGASGIAAAQTGKKAKALSKAPTSQEAPSPKTKIAIEGALTADPKAGKAVDPSAERPRKIAPAKSKG